MNQVTRTVDITQADIDEGVRCSCYHCPAARALARTFPELSAVGVIPGHVVVKRKANAGSNRQEQVPAPEVLDCFAYTFDHIDGRKLVKPISFELTVTL